MMTQLIPQGVVALVGFLVYALFFRKPKKNLPPGPKGLPLVGNVFDMPAEGTPEYLHWLKFKDIYGPLSSVTVLGQTIILIHGRQEAQDILEKTSLKTGGRPVIHFSDFCGFGKFLTSRHLSPELKVMRKFIHQALGTTTLAAKYAELQEQEALRFLLRTLREPTRIVSHFQTEAAAIVLKLVYDYTVEPNKPDPLVNLIDHMMIYFSRAAVPFGFLMEFIPAVRYLPDSLPGMGFKTAAKDCHNVLMGVIDKPYEFARMQMATGNGTESVIAKSLGDHPGAWSEDRIELLKWTAGAMYGGGSDTTVSSMTSFILAMTLFPEIQRKAQTEIDTVTGGTRLPQLGDREQMPYVNAIISEALRWLPVLPLCVPHTISEDITYNGYDLPKGAIIIPSIYWLNHNPDVYAEPDAFAPERFLSPRNEPDPRPAVFGFGRRICPGRYLADSSLFLTIANILAVFSIGKAVDEQGRQIEPKVEPLPGLILKLNKFPYQIAPRSEKHEEFIRHLEREHTWHVGDSSLLGELPPLNEIKI